MPHVAQKPGAAKPSPDLYGSPAESTQTEMIFSHKNAQNAQEIPVFVNFAPLVAYTKRSPRPCVSAR
jgi:hypothetical protein